MQLSPEMEIRQEQIGPNRQSQNEYRKRALQVRNGELRGDPAHQGRGLWAG